MELNRHLNRLGALGSTCTEVQYSILRTLGSRYHVGGWNSSRDRRGFVRHVLEIRVLGADLIPSTACLFGVLLTRARVQV